MLSPRRRGLMFHRLIIIKNSSGYSTEMYIKTRPSILTPPLQIHQANKSTLNLNSYFIMHLKPFIITQLAVFTVLAAPSNLEKSERNSDAPQQPAERDLQRRAWSFYAGGGGCLTGWNGQCNYTCKDNIRTEEEYHSCVLTGSEIGRFGCFPGWSKCKCKCA